MALGSMDYTTIVSFFIIGFVVITIIGQVLGSTIKD